MHLFKKILTLSLCISLIGCGFFNKADRATAKVTSLEPSLTKKNPNEAIVRPGDDLHIIAWRYNIPERQLARLNNLSVNSKLIVGQKLRLTTAGNLNNIAPVVDQNKKVLNVDIAATKPKYKVVANIKWALPIDNAIILNNYDKNKNTVLARGIVFTSDKTQKIRAVADGKVVYCGDSLNEYGKLVIIQHGDTYLSAYAYNQHILVEEGQAVTVGQEIAIIGKKSGIEKNALHFEIRKNGNPINPKSVLPI